MYVFAFIFKSFIKFLDESPNRGRNMQKTVVNKQLCYMEYITLTFADGAKQFSFSTALNQVFCSISSFL